MLTGDRRRRPLVAAIALAVGLILLDHRPRLGAPRRVDRDRPGRVAVAVGRQRRRSAQQRPGPGARRRAAVAIGLVVALGLAAAVATYAVRPPDGRPSSLIRTRSPAAHDPTRRDLRTYWQEL